MKATNTPRLLVRNEKLSYTRLARASLTRSLLDAHVLAICVVAAYISSAGGHSQHVEALPRKRIF